MRVTWDPAKNERNRRKHGVSFEKAQTLFTSGTDYLELLDAAHSVLEERLIAVGPIIGGTVMVVFTERDEDTIRIISARWATKRERELFSAYLEAK